MNIDVELLQQCPTLSKYEVELLRRIDADHLTQATVAKLLMKTRSTICAQRKRALVKYAAWVQSREKQEKAGSDDEFDRQVFYLFNRGDMPNKVVAKLGKPERVFELWKKVRGLQDDDYLLACKRLAASGFELDRSSKHPLYEQVDRIIRERYWLSEEKRLVWKVIRDSGNGVWALGLSEYDYDSTPKVVQRIIEHLTKKFEELQRLA
jgi:hypothetical protein